MNVTTVLKYQIVQYDRTTRKPVKLEPWYNHVEEMKIVLAELVKDKTFAYKVNVITALAKTTIKVTM